MKREPLPETARPQGAVYLCWRKSGEREVARARSETARVKGGKEGVPQVIGRGVDGSELVGQESGGAGHWPRPM